jgi:peptidoglycan DL-endopeptidase CwlO
VNNVFVMWVLPVSSPLVLCHVEESSVTSTTKFTQFRRAAIVIVLVATGIPASAVASYGAATTVVSAATNDPLAIAAANALDLLRGGTGKLPPISQTTPPTLPAPVTTLPTVESAPQTVPPTQPVVAPPSTQPQPPIVSSYIITNTLAVSGADRPSQFAVGTTVVAAPVTVPPVTQPVVSLLPPPTELTLPASAAPASVTQQTIPATIKAKKKSSSTTLPVAVGAVSDPASTPAAAPALPGSYDVARRSVAQLVASRTTKLDVEKLDRAWAQTEPRRMMAVYAALAQVGTNYRYSGNEPGGFDCSGLTSYAWAVAGVKIPRVSTDQINAASPRSADQLLPGDLVWRPGHIMMYLGADEIVIDSPQTGKTVRVRQWGRTSRYGSPI